MVSHSEEESEMEGWVEYIRKRALGAFRLTREEAIRQPEDKLARPGTSNLIAIP